MIDLEGLPPIPHELKSSFAEDEIRGLDEVEVLDTEGRSWFRSQYIEEVRRTALDEVSGWENSHPSVLAETLLYEFSDPLPWAEHPALAKQMERITFAADFDIGAFIGPNHDYEGDYSEVWRDCAYNSFRDDVMCLAHSMWLDTCTPTAFLLWRRYPDTDYYFDGEVEDWKNRHYLRPSRATNDLNYVSNYLEADSEAT